MTRHLRITHLVLLFVVAALSGVAMTPVVELSLPVASTPEAAKATPQSTLAVKSRPVSAVHWPANGATATPTKPRQGSDSVELQAGHSDWIAALAILIVLIIVIPILIMHREWRGG